MNLRERLARFLCEEDQWRNRVGPSWRDLSNIQKDQWREEADRYVAHLEQCGLRLSQD